MKIVLICTVGGSHEPIVKSIKHHSPDYVIFVCSEDDPDSGQKGSYTQIIGAGSVCVSPKARATRKPDLPNIPTQTNLAPDQFEILKVSADNPSSAIKQLSDRINEFDHKTTHIIADYTGGTKSMSCSLFVTATQDKNIQLSLVKGPRVDLIKVSSGMETVENVDTRSLYLDWRIKEARQAWRYYSYRQAEDILERDAQNQTRLPILMSRGYACWDEFDHEGAKSIFASLGRRLPKGTIQTLARITRDDEMGEALKIWDLFLMSDRRATSKRYDTAVLLLYRVAEWIAQWTLRWHHEVDCSDVGVDKAKALKIDDLTATARNGNEVLGLYNAWSAIARLDGPLSAAISNQIKPLQSFAERRNRSMFAHGMTPLSEEDWRAARRFVEPIIQALRDLKFKGAEPHPQLPTELPA